MKMNPFYKTGLLPALLLLMSTACEKDISNDTAEQNVSSSNELVAISKKPDGEDKTLTNLLKKVKQATSRFHSTTQAIKAGYAPSNHCVSHPQLGGMGYHWLNETLVDAEFDPQKPEAILYARGPNGKLRIVAVEYIVINIGQSRPMFGDHPFDINGTPVPAPHWSLHVWLYENNPSGIFFPFNPNITCQ